MIRNNSNMIMINKIFISLISNNNNNTNTNKISNRANKINSQFVFIINTCVRIILNKLISNNNSSIVKIN